MKDKERQAEEKARAIRDYYMQQVERQGCAGPSLMLVVIMLLVLSALVGCRTTQYVEVPVTHTEYVYRDRVDTSYVKDSVYIREQVKGDTVRIVEYRYRDRFRTITEIDTMLIRDTVSVVHPVVVEKTEYRTRGVVKALAWLGLAVLLAGIGYAAWRLWKWKYSS